VSGLRDMLGLAPGDGTRLALRRELERRVAAWDRPGSWAYRGSADLLLQHGEFFVGREVPEEYAELVGAVGGCFENAADAAEARPELRYFQGVYSTGSAHYTPHGWCVAPDGGVVEVTWPTRNLHSNMRDASSNLPVAQPDRIGYWGVEMRPELMRWFAEHVGGQCLLDRPAADAAEARGDWDLSESEDLPLLRHRYDKTRVSF
jgi:hypothetical protein